MPKLLSLVGLAVFLALAWSISENRKKFPWRIVLSGVGLQFLIGILILKTVPGQMFFSWVQKLALKLLSFANEGTALVFGPLASFDSMQQVFGANNAFVFVITVTGTIILVASVSALLYHYGILQRIVRGMAWVMQRVMGTSGSESLAAAANVFMGQTEAPLVVKPYLLKMTRSELLSLMTGGMATIAGGVLVVYVFMGANAGHLLTASIMSAPAALLIAKIMLPESQVSETIAGAEVDAERDTINGLDAMCRGASDGLKLSMNVMAMLIAFTAAVALLNYLIFEILLVFGWDEQADKPLQILLGYLNWPFAFLMGIPSADCFVVSQAMGERIVLNEFFGYDTLTKSKELMSERAFIIGTYALCGFANFASIAIQIGGISAIAPERRQDLAKLGLRAMVGGILASYTTATIAGMLI